MSIQEITNEKVFEFLITDFNDTSEHLRVTGRKIEFTFQLYVGLLSLLITLVVSFLTITPQLIEKIFSQVGLQVLYWILFGILVLIGALTWWVFEFSLRGSMMNSLYINRMNFLRREIYQLLGSNTNKFHGFSYVSQLLPNAKATKVGLTDLYSFALQVIFSIFIIPALCVCVFLAFDPKGIWAQTHILFLFILTLLVVLLAIGIFNLFEYRWKSVTNETKRKIQINWNVRGETE